MSSLLSLDLVKWQARYCLEKKHQLHNTFVQRRSSSYTSPSPLTQHSITKDSPMGALISVTHLLILLRWTYYHLSKLKSLNDLFAMSITCFLIIIFYMCNIHMLCSCFITSFTWSCQLTNKVLFLFVNSMSSCSQRGQESCKGPCK